MVELRASNPKLSLRAAAKEAARQLGLKGQPVSHLERLRKKFAAMEEAGTLPVHESNVDRKRRLIKEAIVARAAWKAGLRVQLAAREQEATALGFDPGQKDLLGLLLLLRNELEACEMNLFGSADVAIDNYLSLGLSPAEADARFLALVKRHGQVKKEVEVLEAIRNLRAALGPDHRVSAQEASEIGQKHQDPG